MHEPHHWTPHNTFSNSSLAGPAGRQISLLDDDRSSACPHALRMHADAPHNAFLNQYHPSESTSDHRRLLKAPRRSIGCAPSGAAMRPMSTACARSFMGTVLLATFSSLALRAAYQAGADSQRVCGGTQACLPMLSGRYGPRTCGGNTAGQLLF